MGYYKDEALEKEIAIIKRKFDKKEFDDSYIRKLVAMQKCQLSVKSQYYDENIAEGNWSLVEEDEDIITLDEKSKPIVDLFDVIFEIDTESKKDREADYDRENNAEYEYVFIPSYYAVRTLIYYYLNNKEKANRIYNLKNAVVRRCGNKFYGGLPFVLRYLKLFKEKEFKSIRADFAEFMEELYGLQINNCLDDFINDIIDCIKESGCKNLILEKRVEDFKDEKEKYYIEYKLINDYKILMHRDVKKDWKHLQKNQIIEVNKKIDKTPNHPNNDFPEDSEPLKGNLKGWYSQDITKKDRLVYKKISDEKTVYIATVCDHYKNAAKRSESMTSYR